MKRTSTLAISSSLVIFTLFAPLSSAVAQSNLLTSNSSIIIKVGEISKITITSSDASLGTVQVNAVSSDGAIATVSPLNNAVNGSATVTITGVGTGKATVTVSAPGYAVVTVDITVSAAIAPGTDPESAANYAASIISYTITTATYANARATEAIIASSDSTAKSAGLTAYAAALMKSKASKAEKSLAKVNAARAVAASTSSNEAAQASQTAAIAAQANATSASLAAATYVAGVGGYGSAINPFITATNAIGISVYSNANAAQAAAENAYAANQTVLATTDMDGMIAPLIAVVNGKISNSGALVVTIFGGVVGKVSGKVAKAAAAAANAAYAAKATANAAYFAAYSKMYSKALIDFGARSLATARDALKVTNSVPTVRSITVIQNAVTDTVNDYAKANEAAKNASNAIAFLLADSDKAMKALASASKNPTTALKAKATAAVTEILNDYNLASAAVNAAATAAFKVSADSFIATA